MMPTSAIFKQYSERTLNLNRFVPDAQLVIQWQFMLCSGESTGVGKLVSYSAQVAGGVKADITEALDDKGLASPAGSVSDHGHVLGLVDEVFQSVENAAAGGRGSAVNATLMDGLSGDAGRGVDV